MKVELDRSRRQPHLSDGWPCAYCRAINGDGTGIGQKNINRGIAQAGLQRRSCHGICSVIGKRFGSTTSDGKLSFALHLLEPVSEHSFLKAQAGQSKLNATVKKCHVLDVFMT